MERQVNPGLIAANIEVLVPVAIDGLNIADQLTHHVLRRRFAEITHDAPVEYLGIFRGVAVNGNAAHQGKAAAGFQLISNAGQFF